MLKKLDKIYYIRMRSSSIKKGKLCYKDFHDTNEIKGFSKIVGFFPSPLNTLNTNQIILYPLVPFNTQQDMDYFVARTTIEISTLIRGCLFRLGLSHGRRVGWLAPRKPQRAATPSHLGVGYRSHRPRDLLAADLGFVNNAAVAE